MRLVSCRVSLWWRNRLWFAVFHKEENPNPQVRPTDYSGGLLSGGLEEKLWLQHFWAAHFSIWEHPLTAFMRWWQTSLSSALMHKQKRIIISISVKLGQKLINGASLTTAFSKRIHVISLAVIYIIRRGAENPSSVTFIHISAAKIWMKLGRFMQPLHFMGCKLFIWLNI